MRKRCRIGAAVLGVTLAALASSAAGQEQNFTPIPVIKGMKSLEKGMAAPTFVVKDTEGATFDFAQEQTKRAHLLVFWSIFCEPCREEMPVIEKIAGEHRDGKLAVLAVNMDGEPFLDGVKGFIRQYKYSVRVLLDELVGENFKIADPYQVAGTPVLYLVDAKGRIFASHVGRIAEGDLKALIAQMLAAN